MRNNNVKKMNQLNIINIEITANGLRNCKIISFLLFLYLFVFNFYFENILSFVKIL